MSGLVVTAMPELNFANDLPTGAFGMDHLIEKSPKGQARRIGTLSGVGLTGQEILRKPATEELTQPGE